MDFEVWEDVPIVLSALGQTAFVLIYGVPALGAGEWWRDFVGRALFVKSLALALLLDVLVVRLVVRMVEGDVDITWSLGDPWDRVSVFFLWLVCGAILYQLAALLRERRSRRRRAHAG